MANLGGWFSGWRKYLLAAALIILGFFCVFFNYAFKASEDRIVREQALEKQQDVGLLCGIVDRLVEMDKETGVSHGYDDVLQFAVQFIEATYHSTFAQAFDSDLRPLTSLSPGVGGGRKHNPLDYPAFVEAVTSMEEGSLTYWYETPEAGGRTVHMAFRWVPTDIGHGSRYLVAVGISKYTIVNNLDPMVKCGAVALILVTSAFIVGTVLLLCHLGHVYDRRAGDKWRGKGVADVQRGLGEDI